MKDAKQILKHNQVLVERHLCAIFDQYDIAGFDHENIQNLPTEKKLHFGMRYACMNGGKRIRSAFALESAALFNIPLENALSIAAAIECMHAYSLVHDDLPAMDNDDFRRSKPTLHKLFEEGLAILVGDALQALSFELIVSDNNITQDARVNLIKHLAQACGGMGMCLGQAWDLDNFKDAEYPFESLRSVQALKTGKLIEFSVLSGAHLANANESILFNLKAFANAIGFAFQIQDDILDATSSMEMLGKTPGKDSAMDKPNAVAILGMAGAKKLVDDLLGESKKQLKKIKLDTKSLEILSDFITYRTS